VQCAGERSIVRGNQLTRPSAPLAVQARGLSASAEPQGGDSKERSADDSASTSAPADGSPVLLWTAEPITEKIRRAEQIMYATTAGYSLSVGAAMLGLAGFMEPGPFSFGLFLAGLQAGLGQQYAAKQVAMVAARFVERLELTEKDDKPELRATCAGGVTRVITLGARADDKMPAFGDLIKGAELFFSLEAKARTGGDDAALEELLKKDLVVKSESLSVNSPVFEDKDVAKKVHQSLAKITNKELVRIRKATTFPINSAEADIDAFTQRSIYFVGASAVLGLSIYGGATSLFWQPIPGALPLLDSSSISHEDSLRFPSFRGPVG